MLIISVFCTHAPAWIHPSNYYGLAPLGPMQLQPVLPVLSLRSSVLVLAAMGFVCAAVDAVTWPEQYNWPPLYFLCDHVGCCHPANFGLLTMSRFRPALVGALHLLSMLLTFFLISHAEP